VEVVPSGDEEVSLDETPAATSQPAKPTKLTPSEIQDKMKQLVDILGLPPAQR